MPEMSKIPKEKIQSVLKEIEEIYHSNGKDAENYLKKARKLKEYFSPGFAVVYSWFYSIPQKWVQVEPKIFKLAKYTRLFDLNVILSMPAEKISKILEPLMFRNEISIQLKNLCEVIYKEYNTWENFGHILQNQSIFVIFKKLRLHKGIRVTFKNLAAMKIFVGMDNNLLILDTHVASVLRLNKDEVNRCRVREDFFREVLKKSEKITTYLKSKNFKDVCMAKWSLAVWFNKAKIKECDLLKGIS
ncbi:MAG: hypothetical protein QXX51_06270 [Candidatus Bathyarchaeia archaeon]